MAAQAALHLAGAAALHTQTRAHNAMTAEELELKPRVHGPAHAAPGVPARPRHAGPFRALFWRISSLVRPGRAARLQWRAAGTATCPGSAEDSQGYERLPAPGDQSELPLSQRPLQQLQLSGMSDTEDEVQDIFSTQGMSPPMPASSISGDSTCGEAATFTPHLMLTAPDMLCTVEQAAHIVKHARPAPMARLRMAMRGFACRMRHAVACVLSRVRPQGEGDNDHTWPERILNVVTCVPFITTGCTVLRSCQGAGARRFGHMFLAVAGIAATYHSASGPIKRIFRLADYWSIALASGQLRNVVYSSPVPGGQISSPAARLMVQAGQQCLRVASYAVIPFFPSLISTLNLALVEVRCLVLAIHVPEQLMWQWLQHFTLSTCAAASFGLDHYSAVTGRGIVPGLHAAWHVFSAGGIATTAPFLQHLDARAASVLLAAK